MKGQGKTAEEIEDDRLIELYGEKLGMGSGKEAYKKIAKNYDFDDDIFDFLDGISKKVNGLSEQAEGPKKKNKNQAKMTKLEKMMAEQEDL